MKYADKSTRFLVIFLILLALAGLVWANVRFARQNPGGNDFLVHYQGTRALLFDGISPYSDAVADRIQRAAYGREARDGEHELRVVYPLYSTVIFMPFAMLSNYTLARALWMTFLEVCLMAAAFLNLRLMDWKPKTWLKGVYFLFSLVWYHSVRGIINGNAVVLITLLVTITLLAIKDEQFHIAGLSLALATIKPHLVLLLVLFIIWWSIWKGNWGLILWFMGGLAVLLAGSLYLQPNWILQNIREILRFPSYNPILTFGGLLGHWLPGIQGQIRWVLFVLLGLILLWEWWTTRKGEFNQFYWICGLTLVITQWIGIPTDPGNFIILYPSLVIVIAVWSKRWKAAGNVVVTATLLSLFAGLWALFLSTIQQTYQPVQSPIMFIPLPAFLFVGLYWVRWWFNTPIYHMFDGDASQYFR